MALITNPATRSGRRPLPGAAAVALSASITLLAGLAGCTFRNTTTPTTGAGPSGAARLALIVSPSGNSLVSVDTAIDFGVRRSLSVGLNPSAIALAQGGREVIVASAGDRTVRIFRRTTGDDIGPGADAEIDAGGSPVAIAVGQKDSVTEYAYVITRDTGRLLAINTNQRFLRQEFFVPIPLPTSLGANARQPVLEKLALSKDPRTNFVRAIYITDSANNVVWQVTQPATGIPQITAITFQSPGQMTVPARLDAITVKASDTQDDVFITDQNNTNLYRATVSPSGGTASLSTGTPVNAVSVLNNNLNISAVHRAIIYRGDSTLPSGGMLFMPEEATGLNTGQNVALVGIRADLSDATSLRANVNVFNVQSTQLRISGVTAMAVNKAPDGTFEFFILGSGSRTLTAITLASTGLARAGGAPQTFPVGTTNPISGSDLVITTN